MFLVNVLMVGGWAVTLSIIGLGALSESGRMLRIRRRLALWLDASAVAGARAQRNTVRGMANAR